MYEQKYLKYKQKYLELKAKLSGGAFWVAGEKYSLMMDYGGGGSPRSGFTGICIMIPTINDKIPMHLANGEVENGTVNNYWRRDSDKKEGDTSPNFWVEGGSYTYVKEYNDRGGRIIETVIQKGICKFMPGFVIKGNKQIAWDVQGQIVEDAGKDLRNGSYWQKVSNGEIEK